MTVIQTLDTVGDPKAIYLALHDDRNLKLGIKSNEFLQRQTNLPLVAGLLANKSVWRDIPRGEERRGSHNDSCINIDDDMEYELRRGESAHCLSTPPPPPINK